jgi:hypothetical protein
MDWESAIWGLSIGFLVGLAFGQWAERRKPKLRIDK